jgi:hypothetical protein
MLSKRPSLRIVAEPLPLPERAAPDERAAPPPDTPAPVVAEVPPPVVTTE